jgi:hypothetical protein
MALEAPFFRREHVLQVPGSRNLVGPPLSEEEFVAEENINYPPLPAREGENSKEKNSGTQAAEGDSPSSRVLRCSALTFDPSPPLEEAKEYSLLAPDDEAELMRWHYRLGHAPLPSSTSLRKMARSQRSSPPSVPSGAGLPFWGHEEGPLAGQRAEVPTFCLRRHQAGGVRLS